jgi:FMN-dependent oxidoreductase (nitrilotriacetate monooxygenase family)
MSKSKSIHLAADLSHYHTDYLWKMPGSWEGYPYYSSPEFYEDVARTASRGIMDMLFFGDSGGTPDDYGGNHHAAVRYGTKWPRHDMMPMIPCMSRAAPGVGFGITMSTTYHHPFHVARVFNGLDHVTKGRIAWNAVTSRSKNEGANYGYKQMIEHDERYERAQEHLGVCFALWDSVEPDAIVLDREKGIFGDPAKVHLLNFEGEYYNVRGPLPALPSPQQRPIIIQAGQSGPGMDLAAHYADVQFSTRRTLPSMKDHRARLDQKLAAYGRQPEDCGVLWSVRVQVAESEAAARAMEERYLDSLPPEAGVIELSAMFGLDFSKFGLDTRLSDVAAEVRAQNVHWGSFEEILRTTDPSLTIGQYGRRYLVDRVLVAAGTPNQIVDKLEEWHFETGANGGFMLARGFSAPGNLQEFVDFVVPELQRRGLSKRQYAGTTLRDNFNN